MPLVWHSRCLHKFKIKVPCPVALYFLSVSYKRLYQKCHREWRLLAGYWFSRILCWPFLSLILKCLSKKWVTGTTLTTSTHHKQLVITCQNTKVIYEDVCSPKETNNFIYYTLGTASSTWRYAPWYPCPSAGLRWSSQFIMFLVPLYLFPKP